MKEMKEIWDKWNPSIYACDICLKELVKQPNRLICPKCKKYWLTDPEKGVLRYA